MEVLLAVALLIGEIGATAQSGVLSSYMVAVVLLGVALETELTSKTGSLLDVGIVRVKRRLQQIVVTIVRTLETCSECGIAQQQLIVYIKAQIIEA